MPFWLFDSDVTASAEFRAETDTVYETNDETVTETSVYRCDRQGTMRFQRIPVDGSQKMDDTYMESIEPYDYHDLVPFSSAYLTRVIWPINTTSMPKPPCPGRTNGSARAPSASSKIPSKAMTG